ncbi:MAG: hypothetical protein NVSMB8_09470 [Candidatus Limnocylindrales bacterium]
MDLSLLAVRVAVEKSFPGFVVVAVKLALDCSAETVRPIMTRAESAMPARSAEDLRIGWFPFLTAGFPLAVFLVEGTIAAAERRSIAREGETVSLAGTSPTGVRSCRSPERVNAYGYWTAVNTIVRSCANPWSAFDAVTGSAKT